MEPSTRRKVGIRAMGPQEKSGDSLSQFNPHHAAASSETAAAITEQTNA